MGYECLLYLQTRSNFEAGTRKITTIPIAINNLKAPYRFDPHPKVVILLQRRDIRSFMAAAAAAMMNCV